MVETRVSVLFVCLGNICRSPLAEGVFLHHARTAGVEGRFLVDSCGTAGYHTGQPADPRSIAVAEKNGVELPSLARRFDAKADAVFEHVIAMDAQNREDLIEAGAPEERVRLLRVFDPEFAQDPERAPDVPDPYYGGIGGFDDVYGMVDRATAGLLDFLLSA